MKNQKDIKLEIHPILEILSDSFSFFVMSQRMMAIPTFQDIIVAKDKGEMGKIALTIKSTKLKVLKFQSAWAFNRFNEKFGVKEENGKTKCNINELLIPQGKLVAIALFEILNSSKYNNRINNHKLFEFAKHLRNGAAHNNKFYFKPQKVVDKLKLKPLYWRGKTIRHTFHDKKQVFGDFIYFGDLLVLIGDISKELYKIDKEIENEIKP